MERRITIDLGDGTTPKASTLEQAEKLGKALAKFQAQEDKLMRLAQQLVPPSNSYRLDTEAIQRTIAECQPDPIFPEDFFKRREGITMGREGYYSDGDEGRRSYREGGAKRERGKEGEV